MPSDAFRAVPLSEYIPLSWSNIILSGAGFFADAYDLFVINVVVDIMSVCSYHESLTVYKKSLVKSIALIGAIIGQIGFGSIADIIGRKKIFITTGILVILGSLCSSLVQDSSIGIGIYSQLCIFRFLLGLGVGGEYPLSAAITSENSDLKSAPRNLAAVFSMQGAGTLLCSLVVVLVTQLVPSHELQWRLALFVGCVPMVVAFYFRWTMHETKAWERSHMEEQGQLGSHTPLSPTGSDHGEEPSETAAAVSSPITKSVHNQHNDNDHTVVPEQGTEDVSPYDTEVPTSSTPVSTPPVGLSGREGRGFWGGGVGSLWEGGGHVVGVVRGNWRQLAGTAGSWLILDIVFYANGLFSGQVLRSIGASSTLRGEALSTLILQCLALPGYIATIMYINSTGLKPLQLLGFLSTAAAFFCVAVFQRQLESVPVLFVALYGVTFFFQNFGPNATTYIIPSVIFTPAQKGTCHGISAASGKLGAILGASLFLRLQDLFCVGQSCTEDETKAGVRFSFVVCGILALLGFIWTIVFVSDKIPESMAAAAALSGAESVQSEVSVEDFQYRALQGEGSGPEPVSPEQPTVIEVVQNGEGIHGSDASAGIQGTAGDAEGTTSGVGFGNRGGF